MRALLQIVVVFALSSARAHAGGVDAADAGEISAIVRHVPPSEASSGETLRLAAAVENAWVETALVARYRKARSQDPFVEVPFERSTAGGYYAAIPGGAVGRPGVEYYVVGVKRDGALVAHFASAKWPHEVRVEPATTLRWTEAERRRLDGRESKVAFAVEALSFGTKYGKDTYVRAELGWTHRVITALYSFTLGYGVIEGETPASRTPDPVTMQIDRLAKGYRYGFGETRLRLKKSMWLDLGAILGFSQEGFAAGVRTQMIFGRDWRSCVKLGAEWLGDMGPSYWLELQWDTAPPFLMSARVRATDLPGAVLNNGLAVDYDVHYPITDRITLGAMVSFSARDRRPGSLGGGLSAAVEF